jgi:hypothetical protein
VVCVVTLPLELGRPNRAQRCQQALLFEPGDPIECRHFNILEATPRSVPMDHFELEPSDDGFGGALSKASPTLPKEGAAPAADATREDVDHEPTYTKPRTTPRKPSAGRCVGSATQAVSCAACSNQRRRIAAVQPNDGVIAEMGAHWDG